MGKALVRDWMTKDAICIDADTTLPEAHDLMKRNNIRRLPVVTDGKLVGIATQGDIREANPSGASSLSIFEINFMLAKLTVEDIMTPDPISVTQETSLHEAAKLLLENKVGGLPVVDDGKVLGIITESDIFRAFIEICD